MPSGRNCIWWQQRNPASSSTSPSVQVSINLVPSATLADSWFLASWIPLLPRRSLLLCHVLLMERSVGSILCLLFCLFSCYSVRIYGKDQDVFFFFYYFFLFLYSYQFAKRSSERSILSLIPLSSFFFYLFLFVNRMRFFFIFFLVSFLLFLFMERYVGGCDVFSSLLFTCAVFILYLPS